MTDDAEVADLGSQAVLRDYLYVDIGRVRSLLAQLEGGVPQQVVQRQEATKHRLARLGIGPLAVEGGSDKGGQQEETRSLQDLHFALFEESAEALDKLRDLSEELANPVAWQGGPAVELGQIIRVSGDTTIADGRHTAEQVERLASISSIVAALTESPQRGQAGKPRQNRSLPDPELAPGITASMLKKFGSFLQTISPPGVSVTINPCGEDQPELCIKGVLLDQAEYLGSERSVLFSRYGYTASAWTTVGIVTRLGGEQQTATPFQLPSGAFNAKALAIMSTTLLQAIDSTGLTDAPIYPGFSITPLAVYRLVPED